MNPAFPVLWPSDLGHTIATRPLRSPTLPKPPEDQRWAQLAARDASADGAFWYGVSTTGVYCRPSCPSRAARRENVTLFDSLDAARAAGFRPCRRCNPDGLALAQQHAALVEQACRLIESAEDLPQLATLADAVEISPAHFHRLFKAHTGLTPRAYGQAVRARRAREALAEGASVTHALHGAGYGSSSRFYAEDALGMAPRRYRSGGTGEQLRFAIGQADLGAVLVASSAQGVAAILLGDDPATLLRDLQDRFPKAELVGGDATYEALVGQVIAFIQTPDLGLDLPLDIRGTAFQQRVWAALRTIPRGETRNYGQIAQAIGKPGAVRAVAGACAANALAVVVPCHRVIRTDGSLSGYAWGVERKAALLEREKA
ncbi:bifunctional DNA-binding transcriptional regulator/O6-methylguanine-DNA methyltransferase Ada [Novosphingobium rosa]|uniref:bifunctional DNA-binding transcriptional regulator/O6-methylguanine-DNA methyltransferase Ada n=1 Tax=Novosphingobium rosa TaxID=76978 RepID=UPI000A06D4BA|nr:bifunctional DNA-binding transcriptional regulator/O6-methylguanine-DNA methyltransferase Ada [Novosphingobium rosa]